MTSGKQTSRRGLIGKMNSYLGGTDTNTTEPSCADADAADDDAAARWSSAMLSSHPAIASVPFTGVNGKRAR